MTDKIGAFLPKARNVPGFVALKPNAHQLAGGLGTAAIAFINPTTTRRLAGRIEKRFFALRKAVWAKPMGWFGTACLRLQHISHGPIPDFLKFIVLLLNIQRNGPSAERAEAVLRDFDAVGGAARPGNSPAR